MEQAGRTQRSLNKLSPEVRVVRMRDDGGEGPILLKDDPRVLVPLFFCDFLPFLPVLGTAAGQVQGERLLLKHSCIVYEFLLWHELSEEIRGRRNANDLTLSKISLQGIKLFSKDLRVSVQSARDRPLYGACMENAALQ